jgi:Big-like domain-containing protein
VHSTRAFRPAILAAAFALLTVAACSDSTKGENHSAPAAIAVSAGGNQVGMAGAPLPAPISVRVTNSQGNPVSGTPVTFTITRGGGTVSAVTVTSDANGIAQTTWTLGNGAVRQTIEVTAGSAELEVTANVDTTRALYLMAKADTVSVGDTIWVDAVAGTSGLSGEVRGAVQETVTNSMPAGASFTPPVYYFYSGEYIDYVQPKANELDFLTSNPGRTESTQRYIRIGYIARQTGAGHNVDFKHDVKSFIGARTFTDLLSRVSVVGTTVHIR